VPLHLTKTTTAVSVSAGANFTINLLFFSASISKAMLITQNHLG
jgi:hypothetical protein